MPAAWASALAPFVLLAELAHGAPEFVGSPGGLVGLGGAGLAHALVAQFGPVGASSHPRRPCPGPRRCSGPMALRARWICRVSRMRVLGNTVNSTIRRPGAIGVGDPDCLALQV
jgi:hypothetical protein